MGKGKFRGRQGKWERKGREWMEDMVYKEETKERGKVCESRAYTKRRRRKRKTGSRGESREAETTIHQDASGGGTTASGDN